MTEFELIGEFDAEVWAEEWLKIIKENPDIATDKGAMIGWFANAIMTGHDIGYEKANKEWEAKHLNRGFIDLRPIPRY